MLRAQNDAQASMIRDLGARVASLDRVATARRRAAPIGVTRPGSQIASRLAAREPRLSDLPVEAQEAARLLQAQGIVTEKGYVQEFIRRQQNNPRRRYYEHP
jgi:hypothetical protein